MDQNIFSKLKSSVMVIVSVIFAALALIGCSNDYTVEDAANIAREDFGCTNILWVRRATYNNNVVENCIPPQGGYYVVGEDKDGNEVYVAVPSYKSERFKAAIFEWKFDYTFSQIAQVFSKYGYKYADGVDGIESEYFYNHRSTYIDLIDRDDKVKLMLETFGDSDELYEKLDVKVMFEFLYRPEGGGTRDFWLTQQGGSLVIYEIVNGDLKNIVTTVYNKDNI